MPRPPAAAADEGEHDKPCTLLDLASRDLDALMHVLRSLDGKTLARLEMSCKTFADHDCVLPPPAAAAAGASAATASATEDLTEVLPRTARVLVGVNTQKQLRARAAAGGVGRGGDG